MTYIKTMLDYVFIVATFLLFSCPAVISSKKLITLKSKSSKPSHPVHFRELYEPFKRQFHKMAKHKQFVGNLPTNCFSVFGYFVGLVP